MIINYKDSNIKVIKLADKVSVYKVGIRTIYQDPDSQQKYVKCFSKWWKFPQEIDY